MIILAKLVFLVVQKLDSSFPHAMKKCTIRDSLKVHHSFSDYLLLEILNKRRGL